MNMWIVYRASDRRVMAMLQLLYEATQYIANHKQEEHRLVRGDPANLEKGKDWFTVPVGTGEYWFAVAARRTDGLWRGAKHTHLTSRRSDEGSTRSSVQA